MAVAEGEVMVVPLVVVALFAAAPRKAPPAPWEGNGAPSQSTEVQTAQPAPTAPEPEGADRPRSPRTFLYVAPLSLLATAVNLELEHLFGDTFALYAGGGVSVVGLGWSWQAGGRWYLPALKESAWRPFVDLHAAQQHFQLFDHFDAIGGGAQAGVRLLTGTGFAVSLGAGADLADVHFSTTSAEIGAGCGSYLCIPTVNVSTQEHAAVQIIPSLRLSVGFGG